MAGDSSETSTETSVWSTAAAADDDDDDEFPSDNEIVSLTESLSSNSRLESAVELSVLFAVSAASTSFSSSSLSDFVLFVWAKVAVTISSTASSNNNGLKNAIVLL